jgi:AraC-like DNA-binding protein
MSAEGPADPLAARTAGLLRRPGALAEDIAGRLDVSERQLRRRCQAAVGYGPATLRRVLRFRRFVSWADAGAPGADLALAAARLGYADQAHLTRECVRLAGQPPTALLAARRPGDEWRGPGPSELARTAGPPTARHRQTTRKR